MNSGQRPRGTLFRWHRRLGVAVSIFVLLLAITGLALNHTAELGLGHRYLWNSWSEALYGVSLPIPVQFALDNGQRVTFVDSGNGQGSYFLDDALMGECTGPLKGALTTSSGIVLLCTQQLVWLTSDGQLIDTVDDMFGLPPNADRIGLATEGSDERIFVKAGDGTFSVDLISTTWQADPDGQTEVGWSSALETGIQLSDSIQARRAEDGIPWERLILDLHAGRFLGSIGPYVMDLAALIFMCLAVSGVWMWSRPKRKQSAGSQPSSSVVQDEKVQVAG